MPAYNAEEYIKEAISSVISQTYSEWELTIVDDGSTDSTPDIIKFFAAKEPRIKHRTIQNSGSAKIPRDMAISLSVGRWIVILDADDYIIPEYLETLVDKHTQTNADIVLSQMYFFENNSARDITLSLPSPLIKQRLCITGQEAVMLTIPNWEIGFTGSLVPRSYYDVLSSVGDKVSLNSDEFQTRYLLFKAQKVVFSDAIYHYRKNIGSVTNKISAKLFDEIETNSRLELLVKERCGEHSPEHIAMIHKSFKTLRHKRIFYLQNIERFNSAEKATIEELIYSTYYDTEFSVIKRGLSIMKRVMYCESYYIFNLYCTIKSYINRVSKKR